MADHKVFKGSAEALYLNGYDVTPDSNQINLDYSPEEVESTSFATPYKDFEVGIEACRGTVDFMFPADHVLEGALTTAYQTSGNILSFVLEGNSAGSTAWSLSGLSISNKRGGAIGKLYTSQANIGCKGVPLLRGKLLEAVASRSASANTAGIQFTGGVSATQTLYIAYHVLQMTATSLDAVLQRDDNAGFSSALTAITMSNFTAIGAERKSLAGPLTDDYFRLAFTLNGAGSYKVAAVIAVQ